MMRLQVLSLVLNVCAFASSFVIQGSSVTPIGEGTLVNVSNPNVLISIAPTPVTQPNGTGLQPPIIMPPFESAPAPQTTIGLPFSPLPNPSTAPTNLFVPPIQGFVPTMPPTPSLGRLSTQNILHLQYKRQYAAPVTSPSSSSPPTEQTHPAVPESAPPNSNQAKAPISNAPIAPALNVPAPSRMPESPSPSHSVFPDEPPSFPPDVSARPTRPRNPPRLTPTVNEPPSSPPAPTARNPPWHSNSAPPPRQFSKHSPIDHHHANDRITPAPVSHVIPPPSSGSSASVSPRYSKSHSFDHKYTPVPAPSPASFSGQAKFPFVSPKSSPSGSSPKSPKMPLLPPMRALPPPPPRKVSELAAEIAAGVFMKQSQVRIMGANAAEDNPEKTIVLIDLLPLGEKFDDTTAYLTFQRFWHKKVVIKNSFFGDYDVLYVRYPGLPPSPPLPPSTIGIIASKPYPGHNNPRTMQPLGVDISGKQQKHGLSRSILATVILSCFTAVILLCAVAWVFVFRYKDVFKPDPTPPTTIPSLAKSSGIPVSMVGSGTSSPSFSLGSSIAAYTGSAKTFSSIDIDRATDFFNETRILGEGGFGRVYSGVLEDGTKIAVKILKRYDQQGGREFLAEVEMLSRLHHRNLVKLIGICVEDRTRCLVYELIPNGSVESHLHGCDKERSPLDWSARLKIALGAARALAYLHEDSSPRVIHRDFKASNILLEDDFTPKVSDFGLARTALDEENRHISTRVMGTFGYVAPEYAMTGHLLVKSDVYSYGVVLLELLTGKKPVDMSQPPGQENLVSWARPLLTSREGLESIIDQSLATDFHFESIAKVAAIASMCVQPEVSNRPFMGEVVQALKLVCNECDEMKESPSRNSTNSDRLPAPLLSPSTVSDYDYRLDVERDLSMSELLSPSAKFGTQDLDSESFRRYSCSGPLRTGKGKPLWEKMRRLSRGSVMQESGQLLLTGKMRSEKVTVVAKARFRSLETEVVFIGKITQSGSR
ncbi:hypothetical protein DH2020_014581 [Rehmannia glutinosa]|uniref:Protein kinase domain-containing protein n=1 Tax=Rehmannia glutinosa TaxID=99300 RepID=A0ABR0WYC2_REHGL